MTGEKPKEPRRVVRSVASLMRDYLGVRDAMRMRYTSGAGRRTKLSLGRFLAAVFETNELNPPHQKLTNAAIERLLFDEFPQKKEAFLRARKSGKGGVNYYRYLYNLGRLTGGIAPPYISFRYNDLGQPVDTRTGKRILTVREREEIIARFRRMAIEYEQRRQRYYEQKRKKAASNDPPQHLEKG